jgi:MoaA/NifB/PqqE/SkfB family radical SAM enzyme
MTGHYILKLNNKCNMNCLFCADSREVRQLPDTDFKEVCRGIKQNRVKYDSLILTGGEPTIYKDLFKILKYAKKVCKYKKISIASNGILLSYEGFLDKLIENGVDSFQISYFALNDKKYNTIARFVDAFRYVNKAIENIVKKKKEIRINLVINKLNYLDLPKITEHLIKLDVNSITLAFMNPVGESVRNGKSILAVPFSVVMPFIDKSFKKAEQLGFSNLYIENFPLCIAQKYIGKISDLQKPDENKDYYSSSKTKTEKCRTCTYCSSCDGIWKAHFDQFGDEEIQPVIPKLNKNVLTENYTKLDTPLLDDYRFEIAGIDIGLKKASILYFKKKEIQNFISYLKKIGFFYEISDFSYITKNEITKKIKDNSKGGNYSVYFSKDKDICRRLKYLDFYHQFKEKEPSGMSSKEVFFEIGEILGYPKCCSSFLLSAYGDYRKMSLTFNKQYQDETIYKILALRNSSKTLYQLNNFNLSYPSFFNFFVCKYDCKNALNIAKKLLCHIQDKYSNKYDMLIRNLKTPLLFFSAYRIINLINATKKSDKIEYEGCSCNWKPIKQLDKNKQANFRNRLAMLSEGNAFHINNKKILIYKDDNLIHCIKKEHENDGILIEFT